MNLANKIEIEFLIQSDNYFVFSSIKAQKETNMSYFSTLPNELRNAICSYLDFIQSRIFSKIYNHKIDYSYLLLINYPRLYEIFIYLKNNDIKYLNISFEEIYEDVFLDDMFVKTNILLKTPIKKGKIETRGHKKIQSMCLSYKLLEDREKITNPYYV